MPNPFEKNSYFNPRELFKKLANFLSAGVGVSENSYCDESGGREVQVLEGTPRDDSTYFLGDTQTRQFRALRGDKILTEQDNQIKYGKTIIPLMYELSDDRLRISKLKNADFPPMSISFLLIVDAEGTGNNKYKVLRHRETDDSCIFDYSQVTQGENYDPKWCLVILDENNNMEAKVFIPNPIPPKTN